MSMKNDVAKFFLYNFTQWAKYLSVQKMQLSSIYVQNIIISTSAAFHNENEQRNEKRILPFSYLINLIIKQFRAKSFQSFKGTKYFC